MQQKEKKKGRELRASFHDLSPVNTAKDLSSLLYTAAWAAKAAGSIAIDFAGKKSQNKYFPAGFALTLPTTQLTRVLAHRRNSSMLAETTAVELPLAAAQSQLFSLLQARLQLVSQLVLSLRSPQTQVNNTTSSKGEVRRTGLQWPCTTKEYMNQQLCPSNGLQFHTKFSVLSMTPADTSYETHRKSFLHQEFTLGSYSMLRSIKIGIHLPT